MTTDLESAWNCVRDGYAALMKYPNIREGLPVAWRYAFSRLSIEHVPPIAHDQFNTWRSAMEQFIEAGKFKEDVSDLQVQQIAAVCCYVSGLVALSVSAKLKWYDPAAENLANMMSAWSFLVTTGVEIPHVPGPDSVN